MNHLRGDGVFVSEMLDGTCGVVFAFTGRERGSFNPNRENGVTGKVLGVLREIEPSQALLSPIHGRLVHEDRLFLCTEHTTQEEIVAVDALITEVSQLPLFLYVADCPAVAIFDPVYKVAALVHSGRKGTELNICQKTVGYLQNEFDSEPTDLLAVIAPYIGACGNNCYELNLTAANNISTHYPESVVSRNNNKVYLDIGEAIVSQLANAGILPENIEKSTLCTKCSDGSFYSYRQRTPEEMRVKPNNGAILCLVENDPKAVASLEFSIKQPLLIFLLLF